jgi:hypothetical protein
MECRILLKCEATLVCQNADAVEDAHSYHVNLVPLVICCLPFKQVVHGVMALLLIAS